MIITDVFIVYKVWSRESLCGSKLFPYGKDIRRHGYDSSWRVFLCKSCLNLVSIFEELLLKVPIRTIDFSYRTAQSLRGDQLSYIH